MIRPATRITAALATTAVLLLTACGTDEPQDKETPLQVKTKAEVESAVRAQADTIAAAVNGKLDGYRANSAPCTGPNGDTADDKRWNLTGFAAIPLSSDKHVTALRTIRDRWQSEGWEISEDRTLPDGLSGALAGRDPKSGLNASVTSSDPPKQLAVIIGSPCYQPASGEDPANE